ncbi:MAG: protein TonB [Gammaproteobacteria bacterium]|jgi:protein TonB
MTTSSNTSPRITASDRLGFTLFLALAVHAIIVLGVGFSSSSNSSQKSLPSLEIILANSNSFEEAENPDYLAQSNQAGGGKSDDKARPSAPVSANSPIEQKGLEEQARQELHKNQLAIKNLTFISQITSDTKTQSKPAKDQLQDQSTQTHKIQQRHARIARLQAEIRQMTIDYARRPKVLTLTASTQKAVEAGYLAAWVRKIEQTGNLNYPAEARVNKIDGQLRLSVRLNSKGEILEVEITRSSGSSVLDEAARRILRLAEPFPVFPEELKQRADQLVIIRTWDFKSNQFKTVSGVG